MCNLVVLDSKTCLRSFPATDSETADEKRERILADSRKISMPIRPVGRPRKDTASFYKEAEIAYQRNSHEPSNSNLFDLEPENISNLDPHKILSHDSHYREVEPVNFEGVQSFSIPQTVEHQLVDTKGTRFMAV